MIRIPCCSQAVERCLEVRWVKNTVYSLNLLLYSRCFCTSFLCYALYCILYLYRLVTNKYDLEILAFKFDEEKLSGALLDDFYLQLLLVSSFMAIPPTVQLVLDSWKLFSKSAQDRMEYCGYVVLIAAMAIPNLVLFLVLSRLEDPSQVTTREQYLWIALTRAQQIGVMLGCLSQLFGRSVKYANNDSLSFLRFSIEKRTVNVFVLFAISMIFKSLEAPNNPFNPLLQVLSGFAYVLAVILGTLMVLRVLIKLSVQAIAIGRFRTHHHISDFFFAFGLFFFIFILILFAVIGLNATPTEAGLKQFLISNLATEVFILVIVTVIPGVKNQRLAELRHEQLETRLNLIRYVSHEMRTPLNTVSMGMKILKGMLYEAAGMPMPNEDGELSPVANASGKGRRRGSVSTIGSVGSQDNMMDSSKKQNGDAERSLLSPDRSNYRAGNHPTKQPLRCSTDNKFFVLFREMVETANQVAESCNVAVSTLDDLLTFDKLDEQKLVIEVEELNPWKLMLDTAKPFTINASLKNIHFKVRLLESSTEFLKHECIMADAFKLAQVMRNLLSNAIKFTPERGTVDVTMKIQESVERGRNVRFSVKDSGAGISKQNMKNLFGQYVQFNAAQLQKGKGSGLGLWITKSIVEMHGGVIGAMSDGEGFGTEFYFDIPLKASSRAVRRAAGGGGGSQKISQKHSSKRLAVKNVPAIEVGGREAVLSTIAEAESPMKDVNDDHSENVVSDSPGKESQDPLVKTSAAGTPPTNHLSDQKEKEEEIDEVFQRNKNRMKKRGWFYSLVRTIFGSEKVNKVHPVSRAKSIRNENSIVISFNNFLNYPVRFLQRTFTASDDEDDKSDDSDSVHTFVGKMPSRDHEIVFDIESQLESVRSIEESFVIKEARSEYVIRDTATARSPMKNELDLKTKRLWKDGLDILIADDSDMNRKMCKRLLTGSGHRVREGKDGLDCLQVYEEMLLEMSEEGRAGGGGVGGGVDLILLDDNMPNLLGYETAKRLREKGYEGVIVGVTGDLYPENIDRFKKNGANEVLGKPLDMTALKRLYDVEGDKVL